MTQFRSPGYPAILRLPTALRRNAILCAVAFIFITIWLWVSNPCVGGSCHVNQTVEKLRSTVLAEDGFPKQFPKKIWQTSNITKADMWANQTASWLQQNPDWSYELITDELSTAFVEDRFADRPALVAFWKELQVTIVKADFIRYLAMLAEGGVYSDMDTTNYKPMKDWIPEPLRGETINAIVGIEYDDNTYPMFVRPISFCQWTLMSKPKHPIFEAAVSRVMYHLEFLARVQRTTLGGLKLSKNEVLEATGPGTFTDAVMEVLRDRVGGDLTYQDFHNMQEPTLFGDVLVLPINAFGFGQKHSHSNDPNYGDILVRHHFGRSWYQPRPPKKSENKPKEVEGTEKHVPGERQDTKQEAEMKPADKEGTGGKEAKKQAPEEDGKETNDEDGEKVLKTNPSTVVASRLDSIKGQPTIGKISILYGKPNPTYERALRLHDVQNQYYGYPMFILRENLLHGLWSKPAYILSVLLQELAKPKQSRLKWLMWFDGDTVVMNPKIPLHVFLPPQPDFAHINILVTNDHQGLNNGVFFIRVDVWSAELIAAVVAWKTFRPEIRLRFNDQSALENVLAYDKFKPAVAYVPQRWFNAYLGLSRDGRRVNLPNSVKDGDYMVHFAGKQDGVREARMDWWMDTAEQHLPKWEPELPQTKYEDEIRKFWAKGVMDGSYKG